MKIHTIKLEAAALPELAEFYRDVLGLEVISGEAGKTHVRIGNSWLVFSENPATTGIYHFAINIPCNQIREGMAWLERAGIALVVNEKGENRIDFPNWNAEAAYFYDPAGNILELIARRDLHNESSQMFGPDSLLAISEIGIATDDVSGWIARAESEFDVAPFEKQKPTTDFAAIGTDMGLLIVVTEGRKWFLTDLAATRMPLEVYFENEKGEMFTRTF